MNNSNSLFLETSNAFVRLGAEDFVKKYVLPFTLKDEVERALYEVHLEDIHKGNVSYNPSDKFLERECLTWIVVCRILGYYLNKYNPKFVDIESSVVDFEFRYSVLNDMKSRWSIYFDSHSEFIQFVTDINYASVGRMRQLIETSYRAMEYTWTLIDRLKNSRTHAEIEKMRLTFGYFSCEMFVDF